MMMRRIFHRPPRRKCAPQVSCTATVLQTPGVRYYGTLRREWDEKFESMTGPHDHIALRADPEWLRAVGETFADVGGHAP